MGKKQKKNQNGRLKKVHFSKSPILKIFCENFMDWPKNTNIAFFACFCPYVGQPHSHIGWDKSMPFASINPSNPRTNPWNFHKKILRIGDFEKCTFLSRPFWIFFCFFPMKISQSLLVSKDGSKFWSSQTWQHFLTHTKHSWGECNYFE